MKDIREAMDAAPPTPECFPDRLQWSSYLLSAQQHAKASSKPFNKHGVFRADWNFCTDCTLAHTTLMTRQGKCNPSQFRVIPIKEDAPHALV